MSFTDPSTLCLFLLTGIVIVLMFRTRVKLAQQRQQADEEMGRDSDSNRRLELPPGTRETANAEHPLPEDLAQWEVQMHETARALSAQLDAKLSLMQALTAEADRAARRLEELLARTGPAPPPECQADSLHPPHASEPDGFSNVKASGVELDRRMAEPAQAESADRSHRRDEIYQLADYGFAPAEIARRIGAPVGEVELILSLRQK